MYVMDKHGKQEDYLHLVGFAYNKHFQASSRLSPFEILYGQKCNIPISWRSPVERFMLGPEVLKDMELTMKQVQHNLKVSQYRKKSQPDLRRTPREFQVEDDVYVKMKPRKSSVRLGKYAKLAPRYCGCLEI